MNLIESGSYIDNFYAKTCATKKKKKKKKKSTVAGYQVVLATLLFFQAITQKVLLYTEAPKHRLAEQEISECLHFIGGGGEA